MDWQGCMTTIFRLSTKPECYANSTINSKPTQPISGNPGRACSKKESGGTKGGSKQVLVLRGPLFPLVAYYLESKLCWNIRENHQLPDLQM
jgi:hypothetical protein